MKIELLAQTQTLQQLFGTISPPTGMVSGDPIAEVGKIVGWGINIFLTLAGLTLLIYLMWGAFDWITSGGEKEKIQKAQNKITNAVIGMLLIFVIFAVFGLLTGDLLGIVVNGPNGWTLKIPTLP